ncbi:hypothetical protein Hypma_002031 [Hypsizygus marmoreus]|uniref:Uncharacterized protein n=1 Tax=Hypsizygus marmoreus TaxID=39966 RepID=A0A369J508_HYPMA|nr:hypothetical protein Hypma_002031 [Hypsizygus marmoreus]
MAGELEFEKLLTVKLGTDDIMVETGVYIILHGYLYLHHAFKLYLIIVSTPVTYMASKLWRMMYYKHCAWIVWQDILGPEDKITLTSVQFKHDLGIIRVKNSWCYTMGPSHQHSNMIVSPTTATKLMNDELKLEEHYIRCQWYLKATTKASMADIDAFLLQ